MAKTSGTSRPQGNKNEHEQTSKQYPREIVTVVAPSTKDTSYASGDEGLRQQKCPTGGRRASARLSALWMFVEVLFGQHRRSGRLHSSSQNCAEHRATSGYHGCETHESNFRHDIIQARTSSIGFTGTIRATRAMTFLFCSDFFRS
jgi:hypothetical protein